MEAGLYSFDVKPHHDWSFEPPGLTRVTKERQGHFKPNWIFFKAQKIFMIIKFKTQTLNIIYIIIMPLGCFSAARINILSLLEL